MNFPSALRIAATTIFVAGASVAGAQLSARSAHGGLFNSLVDWNPAAESGLVGAGDVRMSPWAADRVQLGTVRAADPNRPWMGYWGHHPNRADSDIIGAEHSLHASPMGLFHSTAREDVTFDPETPVGGGVAGGLGDLGGTPPMFPPNLPDGIPPLALNVGDANVIINPEPSVYWLSAAGLVLIAVIRRYRLA
jgi:hypothetical protein